MWFYMTECWFLSDWLHCFGSFWPIFTFMTNYMLCRGWLWSYNISDTKIHHFLSNSNHSIWFFMRECWFFSDFHFFSAHFGPFLPILAFLVTNYRLYWGCFWSYNIYVNHPRFLSDTIHSIWFCVTKWVVEWIYRYFLIFLGHFWADFLTFCSWVNTKYLLNGQKFYDL